MGKISFEQHAILIQLTGPFCFNVHQGKKMQTKLCVNSRVLPVPATSLCQLENEEKYLRLSGFGFSITAPFLFIRGVNIEP